MEQTTANTTNHKLEMARYPGFALKQNIKLALDASQDTNVDASTLQQLLSAAQKNVSDLEARSMRGQTRKMWLAPRLPTEKSAELALKVFSIPELAEQILRRLPAMSLLRAQLVNRSMHNLIQSSIKLQKQLFLMPHQASHLRMLDSTPRSSVKVIAQSTMELNENLVQVEVRIGPKLPKGGSRVRQMHPCQPPISSMSYFASCCRCPYSTETWDESDDDGGGELRLVERDGGLILDDLLKAADEMMADHKLCAKADWDSHEMDGFVRPRIIFGAKVKVAADDPIILEAKKRAKREEDEVERQEVFRAKMEEYSQAKLEAYYDGDPIPTLAEFEAAVAAAEAQQT